MQNKIKILCTGGTIDKVYFDALSEFKIGNPQISPILQEANAILNYEVVSLLKKDSLEISNTDRDEIRRQVETSLERRIIITHGTDTMTTTAEFLADIKEKVIVFTGSMEPARLRYTDAIFNVGCAVTAVQCLPPGVYITMNGQIFNALKVRKNRASRRFEPTEENGIILS